MAISEKKRQKKLQKQKKRNLAQKISSPLDSKISLVSIYSQYPIHECLVPDSLFETGIGNIVISRWLPGGEIGICAFMVDVFYLGVKNALFIIYDQEKYENIVKPKLSGSHETQFNHVSPAFAKSIITGAVDYAHQWGFSPHPDYKKYKIFLNDINKNDCKEQFVFGHRGKPFYISGPNETAAQSKRIIQLITKNSLDDCSDLIETNIG